MSLAEKAVSSVKALKDGKTGAELAEGVALWGHLSLTPLKNSVQDMEIMVKFAESCLPKTVKRLKQKGRKDCMPQLTTDFCNLGKN